MEAALLGQEFGAVAVLVAVEVADLGKDVGAPFPTNVFRTRKSVPSLLDLVVTLAEVGSTPIRHVVTPARKDIELHHVEALVADRRRIIPSAGRPFRNGTPPNSVHPNPQVVRHVKIMARAERRRTWVSLQAIEARLSIASVELRPRDVIGLHARRIRPIPSGLRLNAGPIPTRPLEVEKISLGDRLRLRFRHCHPATNQHEEG